jgi:hypothetical protein
MKLPGRKDALVPRAKLVDYLLSLSHPDGRSKALFFRACGFNETNYHLFTMELQLLAMEDVTEVVDSPYGTKYVIDGWISTPLGREIYVKSVWIIDVGKQTPRLITCYPVD